MENNAPGFKSRKNADGSQSFYWVARNAAADPANFPLKTVRLHGDMNAMSHRCRVLTAELRQWLADLGNGPKPLFDGTISGLIQVYRRTPESPYHEVKPNTRVMYDESLDLLDVNVGERRIDKLTGLDFRRWYNNLKEPTEHCASERVRRAYKAMQLLRIIVKFGVVSNITECFRLSQVLSDMEFASPPARTLAPTFDMVRGFCAHVLENGDIWLAIAQALQFELTLRQSDVIGQWEPCEPEDGGILYRGKRWSGGLQWSHISDDWILEKKTTKRGQIAWHDIKAYPFLHSLLQLVPNEKRIGPVIIAPHTGLPPLYRHYAAAWRRTARAVGYPDTILNRDSRAGGATEGSDAGADLEHLRHQLNHSDAKTTSRYNRNTLTKTREVARLRVAHRSEK